EFRPRRLFEKFNIEVLATTDAATDLLDHHRAIRESGVKWRVVPTFSPDGVVNIHRPDWHENIMRLGEIHGRHIEGYRRLIEALEERRGWFKGMGATATDHAAATPYTIELSDAEAESIFQRAIKGKADEDDAARFTGHMLIE